MRSNESSDRKDDKKLKRCDRKERLSRSHRPIGCDSDLRDGVAAQGAIRP